MTSCSEPFELAGNLQDSNQTGSLSLSTVITYHSTQSPVFDLPGPSILPTPLLSDSPPKFNPHPFPSRIGDAGFENAIEIDLFDGMGRGYCHIQSFLDLIIIIIISGQFIEVVDSLLLNLPSQSPLRLFS
jgi:hypothetical protein